jgi:hypothetical protein
VRFNAGKLRSILQPPFKTPLLNLLRPRLVGAIDLRSNSFFMESGNPGGERRNPTDCTFVSLRSSIHDCIRF